MDQEIQPPADDLFIERVKRMRQLSPSRRMALGPGLWAESCARMRSGLRSKYPDKNEQQINQLLAEAIDRLDKLEDHGILFPVENK